MYGAMLGDIAGSRFEFDRDCKTKDFKFITDECDYTDDSVMTVAVGEALMDAGKEADDGTIYKALIRSMQKWGRKYPDAGYGARFIHWIFSDDPRPYGSFGNGSAMRVSAAGWLYDTLKRTLEVAEITARVSHDHPEGIKGAKCTAAVIYLGRTGHDKEEIKDYVIKNFEYDFSESLSEMRRRHEHVETCMDSLPKALRAFFDGNSYEDVVRNAIFLGGDTDTLAAIAGAMAEGYYGHTEWYLNAFETIVPKDMVNVVMRFNERIKKDPEIEEAEALERMGDDEKLFDWAYHHDHGAYSDEVLAKAAEIYEKLAAKGDAMAMNNLGSMYYKGIHFKEDYKMAEKYYRMACDKGIAIAYGNLACVYYYGKEELRDYDKCYDILVKGTAFFNDAVCNMRLGDMYRYGKGTEKNETVAFHMYAKALNVISKEEKGQDGIIADVRLRIGECFLYGIGTDKDAHEALFNFCIAMSCYYAIIDTDPFALVEIKKLKKELKEAQDILEEKQRILS